MILSAVLLSLKQKEESRSIDVQRPLPYILMPFKMQESSSSVNGTRYLCFTPTVSLLGTGVRNISSHSESASSLVS